MKIKKILVVAWMTLGIYLIILSVNIGKGLGLMVILALVCGFMVARNMADILETVDLKREKDYMTCPGCGCRETYHFDSMDDDFAAEGEEYERCAACGFVFDIDLAADDNPLTQP